MGRPGREGTREARPAPRTRLGGATVPCGRRGPAPSARSSPLPPDRTARRRERVGEGSFPSPGAAAEGYRSDALTDGADYECEARDEKTRDQMTMTPETRR